MPSKLFFVFFSFCSLIKTFAQEKIWVTQTKVSEVIAFEKKINPNPKFLSQSVSLSKDYYPFADKHKVTNPIIVQREPLAYLPIYAEYFYTPGDSILRLVSYDWEKDRYGNFFDKQKIWEAESKKLDIYNKEYERIRELLLPQLGKPIFTDTAIRTVNTDDREYFARESVWDSERLHAELDMTFASMTYRIRLTIYWKE